MRLGVCYYPEHWPEAMWERDAANMRDLGLSLVRIGEFAWSRLEPTRGQFTWDWLDRAIETLASAELSIVLGTPSATPPRWLVREHPSLLAIGPDGRPRGFGSRRHYCFSSPIYRDEACRIAAAMAQRYGNHPAIKIWQIDNEYGCHSTVVSYSAAAAAAFRDWLAARYGTIEALNQAWGNVFWSMEYPDFDAIDPPVATVTEANPAHRLDWRRFSSDQVVKFNHAQIDAIRPHAPGVRFLHNTMGFFTEYDHRALAADLDVVGWDSYPLGFLDSFAFPESEKQKWCRTGHPDIAAFHHDLYRGIGAASFGVMEQQAGPVNWAPHNPAPHAGMVRLWTLEAFAHGADFVAYFRWRQCRFAQEQMHSGLRLPNDMPDVGFGEVATLVSDFACLEAAGADTDTRQAAVALVFDYESQWLIETQPQGSNFQYMALVFQTYSALRRLGLDVDIVSADDVPVGYRLIVVPSLPILDAERLGRLQATGALILFGPRSGSKTVNFAIPEMLAPGPLGTAMNFSISRVESLRSGVEIGVQGDAIHGAITHWREYTAVGGTAVAARCADGAPALLEADQLAYLAGWPDEALLESVLIRLANRASVPVRPVNAGLRIRRRGNLHFAFNAGPDPATVPIPKHARLLIGNSHLNIAGVAVWLEQT
ncbi:MAG: beta-galactosidase [Acidiphilium sp. 37-64-53]|uniref:beta-galactosidase n=1 Tax=unclassified Acidiphilium TaxID=2617493 RepID=UPI000BD4B516|nr:MULTISPECIES: beta-galactosidase [unclassified Acidiphilium]OYV99821.1 MAG: beta-galactosidase [Acidiphilium sp. 37-64-53]OZB22682.1 MAG: beta-galactosidase [Acidiphilium sp. 34-64-41]HQT90099.1 beta-galactosidase [Acidiphilium sp.]